jgi:hypothetical protein
MFAQVALLKALNIWKPKPPPASRKKRPPDTYRLVSFMVSRWPPTYSAISGIESLPSEGKDRTFESYRMRHSQRRFF